MRGIFGSVFFFTRHSQPAGIGHDFLSEGPPRTSEIQTVATMTWAGCSREKHEFQHEERRCRFTG